MTDDAVVEAYRERGFVNAGPLLTEDEVEVLRVELDRVIADRDRTDIPQPVRIGNLSKIEGSPVWQIVNIWQASEPFKALLFRPELGALARQMSGSETLRIWHDQIQYKPQAVGGVNAWHQDGPYWPNIQPKDEQHTAWIALDDVDEGNGCMSMVPGSHRWGVAIESLHQIKDFHALPETYEGHALEAVTCPVKKGHVHFHHSLTWHGSRANTSDRPRRAIAFHFMTPRTTYDASGSHIMKPQVTVPHGAMLCGSGFPELP
ncbi:MAG: phytanoyl-CoA dioxygenase family protein [Lentisphaerae bacterium]|nr:phytanoyl-CoA dioxygenase family protein [Lentisphaerota bacterium]